MARKRFHGLKKVKVRATWSKYNLYNLSRLRSLNVTYPTFYQQKWLAKSTTRAYHGEQIREKQWQRMFRSRLPAVVPMDHRYLGEHDGSEHAEGRGSGKEKPRIKFRESTGADRIPYMNMTYAPIERRLDMAVWRALFASSARQARQFVTHGMVKVNGQKMPYAGYLLNPGDMFQVEIDRVLFATGAPKTIEQIRAGRKLIEAQRRSNRRMNAGRRLPKQRKVLFKPSESTPGKTIITSIMDIAEIRKQRRLDMKELLVKAEAAFEEKGAKVGAKRKIALRTYLKELKTAMSTVNKRNEAELDEQLTSLVSKLAIIQKRSDPSTSSLSASSESEPESAAQAAPTLSLEEQKQLREAIVRARENPIDESKPYATPWRPRPFMSPFAFIPRYLEVNHNICAAVYLRHPVARPGLSEVPSPFSPETHQLAFNWYLRRR